jgi:hypothetical protein
MQYTIAVGVIALAIALFIHPRHAEPSDLSPDLFAELMRSGKAPPPAPIRNPRRKSKAAAISGWRMTITPPLPKLIRLPARCEPKPFSTCEVEA